MLFNKKPERYSYEIRSQSLASSDKKFKRGLYDAKECIADESFLNQFHIMGIDPGNKILLCVISESGKRIKITKGRASALKAQKRRINETSLQRFSAEAREISHINRNNNKMKDNIKIYKMDKIYKELANTEYKKTIQINKYSKFIKVIRDNWSKLWNFYSSFCALALKRFSLILRFSAKAQKLVQKLELDTYINKKKAINKIVRKIVPKKGKRHHFNKYKSELQRLSAEAKFNRNIDSALKRRVL